jgi:hypothetical protein
VRLPRRGTPRVTPHESEGAARAPHPRGAPGSLVLLQETTKAGKRILDASQPERMPQRGLRRGNHRFADRLLQRRHHSVRAGIETGNNERVCRSIPAIETEPKQGRGVRFG